VSSGSIVGSAAFWSLGTWCWSAVGGASGRPSGAVAVQIVEKVDGEVVDVERINLVHADADLGLLFSSAHDRLRGKSTSDRLDDRGSPIKWHESGTSRDPSQ
jgi:hypothetical protein